LAKEHEFRKDFTPEQYAAYLKRKAKTPDALIPKNKVHRKTKIESKKRQHNFFV
jgi:hypothetical protein